MSALSTVDAVTYVLAGSLAFSKLFSAATPLWAKLPRWVVVVGPSAVVLGGQAVLTFAGLGVADFVKAGVLAAALMLPGAAEAGAAVTKAVAVAEADVKSAVAAVGDAVKKL